MQWIRSGIEILRSRRSLTVVAGMKKPNDHAEPTKVENKKNKKTNHLSYSTAKPVNSETSSVDQSTCQHRQQLVQSTSQYVNSSVRQQLNQELKFIG